MTKFLRLILGLVLFICGEYFGNRVFTYYDQKSFIWIIGILAVIMVFVGTALILEVPFRVLNNQYYKFIEKNKVIANLFCVPMFFLAILLFVLPATVFYYYSGKYHKEQIDHFGVTQDIIIDNESHGKNSNNYSDFTFYHKGEKWRGSLRTWKYKLGDSAKIIYSSENPNEVEWYERYLETKKNTK